MEQSRVKAIENEDEITMYSGQSDGSGSMTGWPYAIPKADEPYGYQVGGNHYAKYAIQPTEYIIKNGIGFCEGNVIKYVTRWKDKGGVDDLKKARHYIEMLIKEAE